MRIQAGSVLILYVCALQFVQGILLLSSDAPIGITSLHIFERFPHLLVGAVFVVTAVAAAFALTVRGRPVLAYGLLLPQQVILVLMAIRVLQAVVEGQYAVGSPPGLSPSFLIADQIHVALAFGFHLWAISIVHLGRTEAERYQKIIEDGWKVIRQRGLQ